MREIKFRALQKRPDMVVKKNPNIKPLMRYGTGIFKDEINTWLFYHNEKYSLAAGVLNDINIDHRKGSHHIIDENTVMQYIGLKDKNGVEIYENDILMAHKNKDDLCKVVYGEFNVIDVESLEPIDRVIGIHTEVIATDEISMLEPFCLDMPLTDHYIKLCTYEVIGNIYENPELLENN